jgi:flagellar basal-body rod protein FlgC
MISAMRPAITGLKAATTALAASASNVVNMRDSGNLASAQVSAVERARRAENQYKPQEDLYRPVRTDNVTVAGGGVRAVVRETDPPHVAEYDPGDPKADEDGLVARPNVDLAGELVTMQQAKTMFSANLKVIRTADEMTGMLLDSKA